LEEPALRNPPSAPRRRRRRTNERAAYHLFAASVSVRGPLLAERVYIIRSPDLQRRNFTLKIPRELFPRSTLAGMPGILAKMLRACRATFPFSLPRAYLIGLLRCSAVGVSKMSFSKVHDAHDLLRTSRWHPRPTRPISS